MILAERLRDALRDSGLDVASLAARAKVRAGLLEQMLAGIYLQGLLDHNERTSVAKELHVSEAWLFRGEGEKERGGFSGISIGVTIPPIPHLPSPFETFAMRLNDAMHGRSSYALASHIDDIGELQIDGFLAGDSPTLDQAMEIAHVLRVWPEWLFLGVGEKRALPSTTKPAQTLYVVESALGDPELFGTEAGAQTDAQDRWEDFDHSIEVHAYTRSERLALKVGS